MADIIAYWGEWYLINGFSQLCGYSPLKQSSLTDGITGIWGNRVALGDRRSHVNAHLAPR